MYIACGLFVQDPDYFMFGGTLEFSTLSDPQRYSHNFYIHLSVQSGCLHASLAEIAALDSQEPVITTSLHRSPCTASSSLDEMVSTLSSVFLSIWP